MMNNQTKNVNFNYLYRYHNINDSIIDDNIKTILNYFSENKTYSMVLYGDQDTGKSSLVKAYLRQYYNLKSIDDIPNCEYIYKYNGLCDNGISSFKSDVFTFCKLTTSENRRITIFVDDIDNMNDIYQLVLKDCLEQYSCKLNVIITCKQIEKIKEYLRSRLHIIRLNKYDNGKLFHFISRIVQDHNLCLNKESIHYIIKKCDHSLMRIYSMLETIRLYSDKPTNINIKKIKSLCSYINEEVFIDFTKEWYENKNLSRSVEILKNIIELGYSTIDVYEMYFSYIKTSTILDEHTKQDIIKIISKYIINFYCVHENDIDIYLFTYDLIKNNKHGKHN